MEVADLCKQFARSS